MEPNEQNKLAKQNQRHGNKEQSDSDQKGGRRRITGEVRGRVKSMNTNGGLMGTDNRVGIYCRGVGGAGESNGEKVGPLIEQQ